MTSQPLPWDSIPVPTCDINRRLAAPSMCAPASWAVDHQGRRLFVVELQGDHWDKYRQSAVSVHGVEIDLRALENDTQLLVLALESELNADIFHALCNSLLEELVSARSSASALDIVLNQLKRWKAFLSGRNARILSPEEVRGLFAELWFLLELINSTMDAKEAINAWRGPERIQQDFIFREQAVEVKTLAPSDPRTVRISSENQLDSAQPYLYLAIVLLRESKDEAGRSLNDIVHEVQAKAIGSGAAFELESKLAAIGYVPLKQYDAPQLEVVGTLTYLVREGFPRITRSDLPNGVLRVNYQIALEHVEPFRCDFEAVLGGTQ